MQKEKLERQRRVGECCTHILGSADKWTIHDTARKWVSRSALLTNWRVHRKGTSQDGERMRATEGHSPPGGRRRPCQESDRERKRVWHSHPGQYRGRGTSQDDKGWQASERDSRPRGGGQDSEIKRVGKGTHILESAEGGTSQKSKQYEGVSDTHILESAEGATNQESKQM
jgi:hypothetical protein